MASWLARNAWLCPLAAIALAAGTLALFGVSWNTAVIVALLLVCPAILIGAAALMKRRRRTAGTQQREAPHG